jgi:hypothetical protein
VRLECPRSAKSRQERPRHILHRIGLEKRSIRYAQMCECRIAPINFRATRLLEAVLFSPGGN